MRIRLAKIIAEIGLVLLGTALLIIAIFAYQLHLDNNQSTGPNRIALVILGTLFLLIAILINSYSFFSRLLNLPVINKIKPFFAWMIIPYLWLNESSQEKPESTKSNRRTGWFAVAGAVIAIFVSLWYITSGKIVTWVPAKAFYDRQANAFLSGQLSLLEEPPAGLATLANPYQYQNRNGVEYLWDVSYYKGKYYLYWGPVPALLAASVKFLHPAWVIEDQYLVFFSISGLAISLAALFYWLQKNYFPNIPGWLVMVLTTLGILNTPVFWLVNQPAVYEAAIATGQFFLILGLYTAIRGMESQKHKILLLVSTGFFWGAAIGSRVDLGGGIIWMVCLICLFLFIKTKKWRLTTGAIIALILPLLAWGGGLGWYNYARFGNILETGHRYQLTGGGLPADYRDIVSASYILPNLYNLLARPIEVHWREFPFFFTPFIRNTMWPKLFFFPRNLTYYYAEPITGLFSSMPVIWILLFACIVVPLRVIQNWQREEPNLIKSFQEQPLSVWLGWMVVGAYLSNLSLLSIFIFSTMRYEADLAPLLVTLVVFCMGWASNTFHSRPRVWKPILIAVGILTLISIAIGLLTNFQIVDWPFKNNNPRLYQAIENFFTK